MASNVRSNLEALGVEVVMISGDKSTKTRLIDIKSKQQIVRIDDDIILTEGLPVAALTPDLFNVDAIIISDYNKGLVTYELVESLVKLYPGPIFIDTKKHDLQRFNGCFVKVNELEFNSRTSTSDNLIVTLGDKGALHKTNESDRHYITRKIEVTDVTGAGDTFLAALSYQYIMTHDIEDSIKFAIRASAITVQHMGVYAPKLSEIL
jgi:D-beta-D-heptose 7-phosphate kinase/D-beta-D-heptose 1-phosphate adenosyltransferase